MLKTVLLASAMLVSAPAFAQDQSTTGTSPTTSSGSMTPAQDATTAPQQQSPTTAPADTTTAQPAQDATVADQSATPPAADPNTATQSAPAEQAQASPAPASPAASPADQVASVVNTEFPSYDKNSDGNLDKTEFGSWMVALKTASDPSTKATDPATTKWVDGAFASADSDKSKAVSKDELTSYLSGAAAKGD